MNKTQMEIFTDSLLPRLYGFAFALAKDEDQAAQLVIDAYTVYILREKDYVSELEVQLESKKERASIKRYLRNELIRETYELARRKAKDFQLNYDHQLEYRNFYDLNIQKRAVLYLKDIAKLRIEDIQEVFNLQRHQVIELLHNSLYKLTNDIDQLDQEHAQ